MTDDIARDDRPASRLARLRARFAARPDSEHELSLNRIFMVGVIILWLGGAAAFDYEPALAAIRVVWVHILAYTAISIGLFVDLVRRPGTSPLRRTIGIFNDIGLFSVGLHFCGEAGAALFPIYLWVIFGNGFRFGRTYLVLAAVTAVVSFSTMAATTPFWRTSPVFAVGILAGLIGLPAYVSGLIRRLQEAKRAAEDASEAKSRFLASVSHELRTPLNAIIGLAELLPGTSSDAERRHMSRIIRQSADAQLGFINSLLDFARIEAGQVEIREETVDLAAVLREVRDVVGVAAWRKGLRVSVNVGAGTPRHIVSDRKHLIEILTNLTGNAVKFTHRGHVLITVGFDADERRLRVAVRDTGIGIAPEAQARVFDSFTQADGTIIDRFGGTGLGLAIVRHLVRLHGGDIYVRSTPGEGSTFFFDMRTEAAPSSAGAAGPVPVIMLAPAAIPLAGVERHRLCTDLDAAKAAVAASRAAGERRPIVVVDAAHWGDRLGEVAERLLDRDGEDEPCLVLFAPGARQKLDDALSEAYTGVITEADGAPMLDFIAEYAAQTLHGEAIAAATAARALTVLVADDNKINRMVIRKVLERAGHHVKEVEDGEAAVDVMLNEPLDMVLMDINMPVMNGIEAMQFYRFAASGRPHLPIVALTADATEATAKRCREAGMDACLTKPIDPQILLDEIEALASTAEADVRAPVAAGAITTAAPDLEVCPVIDPVKLADLEALGGAEFVDDLVGHFVEESARARLARVRGGKRGRRRVPRPCPCAPQRCRQRRRRARLSSVPRLARHRRPRTGALRRRARAGAGGRVRARPLRRRRPGPSGLRA